MGLIKNIDTLGFSIQQANDHFLTQVKRQVNTAMTVLNWIIGFYIVEYEQKY